MPSLPTDKRFWSAAAVAIAALFAARAASAAVYNCGAGDVACLRSAMSSANVTPEADTIRLAAGTYTLTWLCCTDIHGPDGLPPVTGQLTIVGAGRDTTVIQRDPNAPQFRILNVDSTGDLALQNLTIRGGYSADITGQSAYGGVGILNLGRLTLSSVAVRDNRLETSFGAGAGIRNDANGIATLVYSMVSGNIEDGGNGSAPGGGGILNDGVLYFWWSSLTGNRTLPYRGIGGGLLNRGAAFLDWSTVSGNWSTLAGGGGIYAAGSTIEITGCTISGNQAGGLDPTDPSFGGGGILVAGNVAVSDSTISQNRTDILSAGGGVRVVAGGIIEIAQSTIADNRAFQSGSGGIQNDGGSAGLSDTILARNTADGTAPDCLGTIDSEGYNVFGDLSGCHLTPGAGDHVGDPGLGTFTDDGTPGHGYIPLLPTSVALDGANPLSYTEQDQLGRSIVDGNVDGTAVRDIGAAEFRTPVVNALVVLDTSKSTLNRTPVKGGPAGTMTINATLTNISGEPIYAPYLVLRSVDGGALLLTADQPPGRVGSRQTPSVGADRVLSQGERVLFTTVFGLQEYRAPAFAFDVLGGAGATTP